MFKTATLSLCMTTLAQSRALDPAQALDYPFMDEAMRLYGLDYGWRAYETVTDDGYILTMFRIESNQIGHRVQGQGSKGPVLLQHGFGTDSICWFLVSDDTLPALPVRLFQEGFDVWLGNNRGTRLSRRHVELDADQDTAYWDYTVHEMGIYDLPAMAKKIIQVNRKCLKVNYLGHSLGTTQLFDGLASSAELQSYFAQMVALSPCFVPASDYIPGFNKQRYALLASTFSLLNIHNLFGPYWNEQVEAMCPFFLQRIGFCSVLKVFPVGPIAGGDVFGISETGVRQLEHLGQLVLEQQFLQYDPAYVSHKILAKPIGQLIDVRNIKAPPISFIYIDRDGTCPPEGQLEYMRQVPAYESHQTLLNRHHSFVVGDNDDEFLEALLSDLKTQSVETMNFADCRELIFS